LKKGDKLVCIIGVNNVIGMPLFEKGKIYEVLYVDGDDITLNHTLYANEYSDFSLGFVEEYFRTLKDVRKEKLDGIEGNL